MEAWAGRESRDLLLQENEPAQAGNGSEKEPIYSLDIGDKK